MNCECNCVGKSQHGSMSTFGIMYASYPLVLDAFIPLAYWNGLVSGVIRSVVVWPKTYEISHCNRIRDSTREVPCFSLGIGCTMCLNFSLFLYVSMLGLDVCFPISVLSK